MAAFSRRERICSTKDRKNAAPDQLFPSSIVWVNPKAFDLLRRKEKRQYHELRRLAAKYQFIRSAALPETFRDYIVHRIEWLQDRIEAEKKIITQMEEQRRIQRRLEIGPVHEAFEGRKLVSFGYPQWRDFSCRLVQGGIELEKGRVEELLGKHLMKEL